MKVGINSRIYQNSNTGIPYFVECLYKKLLEKDKKNSYTFFQTSDIKKIGNTITYPLANTSRNAFFFDLFFINTLLRKHPVDVLHCPAHIMPFLRQKGVKYVVTVHDLAFIRFPQNHSKLFNWYYRYAIKFALKHADAIIVDSKQTRFDIHRFYTVDPEKIKTIYLGVNAVFFTKKRKKRLIKTKYFFSITTHPKRKNTISVLQVMAKNRKLREYTYVIAGLISDEQSAFLKEEIKRLRLTKRVILFGYATLDELISLYQHAEFFIYPSFYEGFGFPVLEAMASKCPVITSNVSSLPELMPDKQFLVDPYDLQNINEKIMLLLSLAKKERQEIIEKNYAHASKFTWDKTAREYLGIFRQTTG